MKPTGKHAELLQRASHVIGAIMNELDGYGTPEFDKAEIDTLWCDIVEYLEGYNPTENN